MGILEVIEVTTIMVRQRITGMTITTNVTIETITIVIIKFMVFTGVSNVTYLALATDCIDSDHIDIDAMVAGS